jgi:hypothetical protein
MTVKLTPEKLWMTLVLFVNCESKLTFQYNKNLYLDTNKNLKTIW